jgi:outer membrane protein OmpA-like peptidoglycan-associated protein
MPGLLTTTAAARERMLARNFYRPDNPYNLRGDLVTKTLDAFRTAGFDLRTSPILAGLEALIDNTPLLQIAAGQLVKGVAVRYADRMAFEKLPPIKLENIFSTDPSKRVIGDYPVDWRITPVDKPTSLQQYVSQAFSRTPPTTGLEQSAWPLLNRDPSYQPGGAHLFDVLGPGQKAWVQEQSSRNNFNRWPKADQKGYEVFSLNPGHFRLLEQVYPAAWLNKRIIQGGVYASYLLDSNGNRSLNAASAEAQTLTQVVKAIDDRYSDKTRLAEGFGQTLVPGAGPAENRGPAAQLVYGPDPVDPALQIERGLLYYTDQLLKTDTTQARAMQHETRSFPGKNELDVVWRGSRECRTFTLSDQYDRPEKLIRWDGNNVPDSVLHDTVIPRIAPQTKADLNRLMFSIENLAYGPADLTRLPEQQRGPHGGRLMWFMPYGIGYTEGASAGWNDVPLAGRIEPLHAYSGASRSARLSFILLADYPDGAQRINPTQLGAWFAGCATGPEEVEPLRPRTPLATRPAAPAVATADQYGGTPTYFFENDVYQVLPDYELTSTGFGPNKTIVDGRNLYALNASFGNEIDALAEYVAYSYKAGKLVQLTVTGSCSALFTSDYNARLSYKRALLLAQQLVARANGSYQAQLQVNAWPTPTQFESELSVASIKAGKKYTVSSTDGGLVITLTGRGEQDAHGGGQTEGSINTLTAKQLRRAQVSRVSARPRVVPVIAPLSAQSTHVQEQAALRAQAGADLVAAKPGFNPRFSGSNKRGQRFARGFEQRDYLAPVFHSQTPYDLHQRHEFLLQCTRPGNTVAQKEDVGSNSLYGRAPVCILRFGDFIHSKVLIRDVQIDWQETKWDLNPEGMGVRPLLGKVSLDLILVGGQSLQGPVNALLTATDFGYGAGATFNREPDFPATRYDEGLPTDQPKV